MMRSLAIALALLLGACAAPAPVDTLCLGVSPIYPPVEELDALIRGAPRTADALARQNAVLERVCPPPGGG